MFFPNITLLKTFCLLLVILLHCLLPFGETNPFWKVYADHPDSLAVFFNTFLGFLPVPAFIFASGFLFAHGMKKKKRPMSSLFIRRMQRLLRPWLLNMLFWLVPLYVFFDLPAFCRPESTTLLETYSLALKGMFVDHLWFLWVLFWASIFWMVFYPLAGKAGGAPALVLAVLTALLVEKYGKGLTWFCLWETGGPVIFFCLGCLAYRYREILGRILPRWYSLCFLLIAYGFLAPHTYSHYLLSWLVPSTGCFLVYAGSLLFTEKTHGFLRRLSLYRYFEDHSFRYYLLHMPTPLLMVKFLEPRLDLPAPLFIFLALIVTFALTSFFVAASYAVEKTIKRSFSRLMPGAGEK